jgi:hypothetical protein
LKAGHGGMRIDSKIQPRSRFGSEPELMALL